MPADTLLQASIKSYLRRTYAGNVDGLKALATQTFAQATESTVTLTSLASEGGSQSGQITCPRGLLLFVLEELIAEMDPTAPRYASAAVLVSR